MCVCTCICVYVWHVLCLRQSGQAPTIHSRGLRHASATGRTRHPPRYSGACVDQYSWLRLWVRGRVKVRVRLGLRLGLGHQPYECDLFSICMYVCMCGLWFVVWVCAINPSPCSTSPPTTDILEAATHSTRPHIIPTTSRATSTPLNPRSTPLCVQKQYQNAVRRLCFRIFVYCTTQNQSAGKSEAYPLQST